MKTKILLSICFLSQIAFTVSSQKKSQLVKVDAANPLNGSPFIILPKTAVKLDFSLVEFTYTQGEYLKSLITITDAKCSDVALKKELNFLEKEYGVNADILIKLLKRNPSLYEKEYPVIKLDKDLKTTFISMADYDKIYKYKKLKSLNSGLLSLEYDENGIVTTSKTTNESKVLPAVFSTVTGIASIIGAILKNASIPSIAKVNTVGSCATINYVASSKLDKLRNDYDTYIKKTSVYTDKQFEKSKEKFEEEIAKEFANLFYSREIRIIPMSICFVIPNQSELPARVNGVSKINLFSYDAPNSRILINQDFKTNYFVYPSDRFQIAAPAFLTNAVGMELSDINTAFNKAANIGTVLGSQPNNITAVYNIPKTERVRLAKATGIESYIDTLVKIPQHGITGYFSMKLSTVDLTYDNNGELKKLSLERKSTFDSSVTAGATAATSLLTAIKGKTEVELLTEKATKLELIKKIEDLEQSAE